VRVSPQVVPEQKRVALIRLTHDPHMDVHAPVAGRFAKEDLPPAALVWRQARHSLIAVDAGQQGPAGRRRYSVLTALQVMSGVGIDLILIVAVIAVSHLRHDHDPRGAHSAAQRLRRGSRSGALTPVAAAGSYGAGIGDASWKKLPSGSSNVASHISAPSPGW